jgi:hypothetical protein
VSLSDELGKLADLRDRGVLSDAELQAAKAKLLSPVEGVRQLDGDTDPVEEKSPREASIEEGRKGSPQSKTAIVAFFSLLLIAAAIATAVVLLRNSDDGDRVAQSCGEFQQAVSEQVSYNLRNSTGDQTSLAKSYWRNLYANERVPLRAEEVNSPILFMPKGGCANPLGD